MTQTNAATKNTFEEKTVSENLMQESKLKLPRN